MNDCWDSLLGYVRHAIPGIPSCCTTLAMVLRPVNIFSMQESKF